MLSGLPALRGAIYDPLSTQTVNGTIVRTMFPGNIIPQSRISAVSRQVLAIMAKDYPATVPGPSGNYLLVNNAYGAYNVWQRYTQISLKGDHNISTRNHLSGSVARTTQPQYQANASGTHVWSDDLVWRTILLCHHQAGEYHACPPRARFHSYSHTAESWRDLLQPCHKLDRQSPRGPSKSAHDCRNQQHECSGDQLEWR